MCHYEGLKLGVEVAAKEVTCSTRRFDYRGTQDVRAAPQWITQPSIERKKI